MIDIRDHGGSFGGGKYRKGSEVNVEDDLTTVSVAGKIEFMYERQAKGTFATIHKAPDGFIYALAYLGSNAVVYKYDEDLNELASKTFSWSVAQAIMMAAAHGYDMYFTGWAGNVYKINLQTLTEGWVYTIGSSTVRGYGIDISEDGSKIAVGFDGNLTETSVILLNSNGTLAWEKIGLAPGIKSVAIDSAGNVYMATFDNSGTYVIWKIGTTGTIIWMQSKITYGNNGINGVNVNRATGKVYIIYFYRIAEINPSTGAVIKLDNTFQTAFGGYTGGSFNGFKGMLYDEQGAMIFAGDINNVSSGPEFVIRIKDLGASFELINADADFMSSIRGMFIEGNFVYVATEFRVGKSGRLTAYQLN